MHLSAVNRMTFLLRTSPPRVTQVSATEHDAPLEWALTSVIVGEGAGATELANLHKQWPYEGIYCLPA